MADLSKKGGGGISKKNHLGREYAEENVVRECYRSFFF
jgi:hypothetical protein